MGSTQKHYLKINPYLDIISGIAVVLSFSDGIIKIIGREGSGKSVLCQLLATELMEEEQEVVIFSDIPHSEEELHGPIQHQLHLDLGKHSDFYTALNRHIQARPYDQQKLILVFDDADQIPEDCFSAIRILFEKNYHDRPEVSMVFAGTELLEQKLNEPANRTFNKNIILNFEVKPMNRSELEAFCNAYMVEMGLQKHHLSKQDLDEIYAETKGLPGKIPELIFAILDREEEQKKAGTISRPEEKGIMSKLVELDDDPEPELAGLSVQDREEVLTAYKDQVPWRWQSNGVGIAVVVLFLVVAYGSFVPPDTRTNAVVIFPPPARSPGQLTPEQQRTLVELLALQQETLATEEPAIIEEPPLPVEESPAATEPATEAVAQAEEVVPEAVPAAVPEEPAPEIAQVAEPAEPAAEPEPVEEAVAAVAEPEPVVAEPAPEQPAPAIVAETPPPAPVPAPAEPAPAPSLTPATGALTFVNTWLIAWESQDLNGYFGAYHPDYVPEGQTRDEWQSDRITRITRPPEINIDIEDVEIIAEDGDATTVRMQFTYAANGYADRTVKELVLTSASGDWEITGEHNVSVNQLSTGSPASAAVQAPAQVAALDPAMARGGESGFEARIRQVLSLAGMPDDRQLNSPFRIFINDWLGAWQNQDVEGYFRHYHDDFRPANFDSLSAWRADRIRKINEKRFIDIAFDNIEVLDEATGSTRIRFWLSYASSFYLDRTLKEVVIAGGSRPEDLGILQERNVAVEIIPFYP